MQIIFFYPYARIPRLYFYYPLFQQRKVRRREVAPLLSLVVMRFFCIFFFALIFPPRLIS